MDMDAIEQVIRHANEQLWLKPQESLIDPPIGVPTQQPVRHHTPQKKMLPVTETAICPLWWRLRMPTMKRPAAEGERERAKRRRAEATYYKFLLQDIRMWHRHLDNRPYPMPSPTSDGPVELVELARHGYLAGIKVRPEPRLDEQPPRMPADARVKLEEQPPPMPADARVKLEFV